MSDLEFFTNEELIDELLSRSTFVGVVIASENEHLHDGQVHKNFIVYSAPGFTGQQVGRTLGKIAEELKGTEGC